MKTKIILFILTVSLFLFGNSVAQQTPDPMQSMLDEVYICMVTTQELSITAGSAAMLGGNKEGLYAFKQALQAIDNKLDAIDRFISAKATKDMSKEQKAEWNEQQAKVLTHTVDYLQAKRFYSGNGMVSTANNMQILNQCVAAIPEWEATFTD